MDIRVDTPAINGPGQTCVRCLVADILVADILVADAEQGAQERGALHGLVHDLSETFVVAGAANLRLQVY